MEDTKKAHNRISSELEDTISLYFHSNFTRTDIAVLCSVSCDTVDRVFKDRFSREERKERYKNMCRIGKLGSKNHMFGKTRNKHHNFKVGEYISSLGYRLVTAPEWWSGTKKGTKIPEQYLVYCEANNLTKIPKGYLIHHKNDDKLDNRLENLQLMTRSEHMRHHATERWATRKGATTSRKT